jgi:predicted metal-binding membrane protein
MAWPAFARMLPAAAALAVLAAGAWQFTPSKSRLLACCRKMPCLSGAVPRAEWRRELRRDLRTGRHMGLHCCRCCAGPMAALLAIGVMDLRAMIAVTLAITAERLAPDGVRAARISGAVAIATGLFLLACPPAGGCA